MAQMPIQLLAPRANQFAGQGAPTAPPPSRATPRTGTYLIEAGGISGGALRPGAMDQAQFKTLLAATHQPPATPEATSAQMVPLQSAPPVAPLVAPRATPGIPTLTPAQLAAFGAIEDPHAAAAPPTTQIPAQITQAVPEIPAAETAAAQPAPDAESAAVTPPTPAPTPAHTPAHTPGPMPRARMGADGVWELPRVPGKDERDMLGGQKWRLVEDPEATRLFLGEDGKFGWDDFVDLINPLQHIPLVNIAYRAITGDEIDGAARLVDFAFGPIAGVSTALDLAFRDVAGDSMANTAVAALFGNGETDAALNEYTTAAATQVADSGRQGSHR